MPHPPTPLLRLAAALAPLALVGALAGCGSNAEPGPPTDAPSHSGSPGSDDPTDPPTNGAIAVSVPSDSGLARMFAEVAQNEAGNLTLTLNGDNASPSRPVTLRFLGPDFNLLLEKKVNLDYGFFEVAVRGPSQRFAYATMSLPGSDTAIQLYGNSLTGTLTVPDLAFDETKKIITPSPTPTPKPSKAKPGASTSPAPTPTPPPVPTPTPTPTPSPTKTVWTCNSLGGTVTGDGLPKGAPVNVKFLIRDADLEARVLYASARVGGRAQVDCESTDVVASAQVINPVTNAVFGPETVAKPVLQ